MAYPFVEFKRKAACWSRQRKDTPVVEKHIGGSESRKFSMRSWSSLRGRRSGGHLQDLLEQEVREWLGREKSERKVKAVEQPGYRKTGCPSAN